MGTVALQSKLPLLFVVIVSPLKEPIAQLLGPMGPPLNVIVAPASSLKPEPWISNVAPAGPERGLREMSGAVTKNDAEALSKGPSEPVAMIP